MSQAVVPYCENEVCLFYEINEMVLWAHWREYAVVINNVISSRNIIGWLQKDALEQLSEVALHLYKLLIGAVQLMKDNVTLKQEELQEFVGWTISTALQPECTGTLQLAESYLHFRVFSEEEPSQDSLLSKLLRWLTASVILGMLSWKSTDLDINILERSNSKTLLSLLEHVKKGSGENGRNAFHCEEILAASIFYLQQLLGLNSRVLPSVVSALCLLLLSDASNSAVKLSLLQVGATLHCTEDCSWPLYSSILNNRILSSMQAKATCGHSKDQNSCLVMRVMWHHSCSRIHCPVEANPAWRCLSTFTTSITSYVRLGSDSLGSSPPRSFYQPWKDLTSEPTDLQKMDELHACQSLLV
ncbi:hypothetical protein CK203_021465 [Vitis vinifera]|uniref:Uncharacterized protein n=1 Tax=Vitis vinifera TaxID=29760 RepID=A0A438ISL5_VITVI|nr:hypothetical protein CK203_021465 [Vitis vinifera]